MLNQKDLFAKALTLLPAKNKDFKAYGLVGKLHIFFGMCAGVGKTYTMLKAARDEKVKGADIIIGYLETHNRVETANLAEGFEIVPRQTVEYKTAALQEIDLDAILLRRPQIVLVDKLYKTLFNSISHELRIPVTTIMGAADMLLSQDYPEDSRQILYNEISHASVRLDRLIENLLLGRFDYGLTEQVIYNLVLNATQHAPAGSRIRLKIFFDNGFLVIQVMDRGKGFTPSELPSVFNKFYRAKGAITGGTGLGLSIVKGFSEAQSGSVIAENRENGGAKITVKIPVDTSMIFPNADPGA